MTTRFQSRYHGLALFSGGLDSILAVKMIQKQGLDVLGLHFVSPFFGHPELIPEWEKNYNLPIMPVDISREFVNMLLSGPRHGLGRIMNPCLDCKILMLKKARQLMQDFQARFIISGEVTGQRPMSQRRDALNIILRDADVKKILIRPLSAKLLPPTSAEESGLVNREMLENISGRGRKKQMEMAGQMNIHPIPTPAGGCLLTEMESSRRYLPVLNFIKDPEPDDFYLANMGRQLWNGSYWLSIGRNKEDNLRLEQMCRPDDYKFKIRSFPGPSGLGRPLDKKAWPDHILESACRMVSRFCPKARKSSRQVLVSVIQGDNSREFSVWPGEADEQVPWQEPAWNPETVEQTIPAKP